LAVAGVLAFLLGGCATQHVRVERRGELPTASTVTGLSAERSGGAPPELAAAVDRRCVQLGLTPAEDHPRYRVEAAYSVRTAPVGAYPASDGREGPDELAKPIKVPWWSFDRHPKVRRLTIRLVESRTGSEVYRGTAEERADNGGHVNWDRLAALALDRASAARLQRR
jgi:hypothetical protein